MKYNGSAWVAVGTAGFSAHYAYDTSLFVENGTPYVAYRDYGNGSRATVMRFNGTAWETMGTVGFSAGGAYHTSLHVYDGTPYVAYQDAGNGSKATVMKYNGSGWEAVGNVGFSAGLVERLSLVLYNGTPYVAYEDHGNGYKATVMRYNGTAWETVGTAGLSTGQVYFTSLRVYNGTPYVAYRDVVNSNKATVMKYTGSAWETVGTAGISAGQANWTSLYIENGTPYVAYEDVANSSKATVLHYAVASTNANLSGLALSAGALSPVFSTGTIAYTASVDHSVGAITVTPTVADATATVTVNGAAVTSGQPSDPIALDVGSNAISVVVTAQDGVTNTTYTLAVTRPTTVPDAPTDISAEAGYGQATVSFTEPAFDGGSAITHYTVTSSPGEVTATGAATAIVVSGLTNGTTYTFTVTATNEVGTSSASLASSPVTPNPRAADDGYSTDEDTLLSVAAPGVLANDPDSAAASLTATLAAGPANGSLTLNSDGSFTYTPSADFNGADSFTYTTSDGTYTSDPATVTITVNAVNDAPSFTGRGDVTANQDSGAYSGAWATDISAGPVDEAGQALTFNVSNTNSALFSVQPAIASNGTLTFAPAGGATGSAVVSVSLSDNGGTLNGGADTSPAQTFTITVSEVTTLLARWTFDDGAGTTAADSSGYGRNATLNGTYTWSAEAPANTGSSGSILLDGSGYGTVSGIDLSAKSFSITYWVRRTVTGSGNYRVVGQGTNGPSTGLYVGFVSDSVQVAFYADDLNTAATYGITSWNHYAFTYDATTNIQSLYFDGALVQTRTATNDFLGTGTFNIGQNLGGTEKFRGYIDDLRVYQGALTAAEIEAHVPPNPVANDDAYSTNEDTALVVTAPGVLSNDTDADTSVAFLTTSVAAGPANGSLTLNSNGSFTYTANAAYSGSDSFTYTVTDGTYTSAVATVTITVNAVNDAPSFTAGGDVTVLEDSGPYSTPWATDISAGPNEASQTVTFAVSNNNNSLFSVQPTISSSGVLTFTPAANANGSATVSVNLTDDGGTSFGGVNSSGTVQFTITVSAGGVSSTGLIAHWMMDEGSGSATADASGNGLTATLNGGYTWSTTDTPTLIPGNVAAIYFDGSSGYATAGSSISLANLSFSVSFWARRTTINGNDAHVVSHGVAGSYTGLHIGFRNSQLQFAFWGDDLMTSTSYTDSNWHHWALTYDATGNSRKVYLDGTLVHSDTASNDYQGSGSFYMGRGFDGSGPFPGGIDDMRVYIRELSAAEVAQLASP